MVRQQRRSSRTFPVLRNIHNLPEKRIRCRVSPERNAKTKQKSGLTPTIEQLRNAHHTWVTRTKPHFADATAVVNARLSATAATRPQALEVTTRPVTPLEVLVGSTTLRPRLNDTNELQRCAFSHRKLPSHVSTIRKKGRPIPCDRSRDNFQRRSTQLPDRGERSLSPKSNKTARTSAAASITFPWRV